MTPLNPTTELATHSVANQPPERGDIDLWQNDRPMREAALRFGASEAALAGYAAELGRTETRAAGRLANRFPPELRSFDRAGRRLDEIEFHPAWHTLMRLGIAAGYPSIAWEGGPGGHVSHAAMVYLHSQVEPGSCCPMTMTYAAVPALAADRDLAATWTPRLLSRRYDPRSLPAEMKEGATLGMAMTEKQGGSDIRSNATRAEPAGALWRLTGHKWFCSAPMSDGFLTLAHAPRGLTCFLVPRWTPAGGRNAIHLMRLKDKLGNRSNASAEIEYHGALAHRLGEEGDGVRTILAMVHHTRLDTAMAPAGLMRAALAEALWWCVHRTAFQRRLMDQPLMAAVLADLALDTEAAVLLGLRVARAFDDGDRAFSRIAVALAKFLNNKRAPNAITEAMECLGGVGYVEEAPLAMLYREAPLNAIWEGSGNVICLDVLRSLQRDPDARDRLWEELEAAASTAPAFARSLAAFRDRWPGGTADEAEARWFTERLALLLAGAVLWRHGDEPVAAAWQEARLDGASGRVTGALPAGFDRETLIERAMPC